jgi:hypothetical protein
MVWNSISSCHIRLHDRRSATVIATKTKKQADTRVRSADLFMYQFRTNGNSMPIELLVGFLGFSYLIYLEPNYNWVRKTTSGR